MRFARARLVRFVTRLRTLRRLTVHVKDREGMTGHGIFVIEDVGVRTDDGSTDRGDDGRI
jgi:hypothetical protein